MSFEVEYRAAAAPPDARALRRQMGREGYSVFEWNDAPRTVYGPHSHAEDQSHWIISGELELTVGDKTYTLRAGDRDFISANTMHSAFVRDRQPVHYLIGAKHG